MTEIEGCSIALTYQVKGTLRWAAPELFVMQEPESGDENAPKIFPTAESDMYSFGGIMLHVRIYCDLPLTESATDLRRLHRFCHCSLTGLEWQNTLSLLYPRRASDTGDIQGRASEAPQLELCRDGRPMDLYDAMLVLCGDRSSFRFGHGCVCVQTAARCRGRSHELRLSVRGDIV